MTVLLTLLGLVVVAIVALVVARYVDALPSSDQRLMGLFGVEECLHLHQVAEADTR